jgi:hypothetical protein
MNSSRLVQKRLEKEGKNIALERAKLLERIKRLHAPKNSGFSPTGAQIMKKKKPLGIYEVRCTKEICNERGSDMGEQG